MIGIFRFMSVSLSDLVDNLPGIFNSIECTKCMEREKNNLECCFVRLKNAWKEKKLFQNVVLLG